MPEALPARRSVFSVGYDLEEAESQKKREAPAPQWGVDLSVTETAGGSLPGPVEHSPAREEERYSNLYLRVTPTIWAV